MDNNKDEYLEFQKKIMRRFCENAIISIVAVFVV